ncbi:MAG: hypothetical protein A2275_10170 [Bacteroidetes bacterium RIFOXYA12_FULL_35_11]|nr:MAG: hypothetical protein A2X01_07480 [Bacteroidetes bacterium GWF2_35_48]OFY73705.1 MAG: hypothetical protein A2275_10170 [Bacteroidetes bacterium RIFOXYA12_FULL_35_11]OFY92793.1 MAG: hypothetical protein A2491_05835 [Bacteroidetes bacterium RIFOXYC12_FULL_35_7]OFY96662.1 MAG: hypothetical protein A2309_05710 [Bacteroidetes bacterium RIFOXYB2_FULL_35_7]HBX52895.1 hypothetical protein [Bacteroidales bacterium]
MRYFYIFCIILFVVASGLAQNKKKIDSLQNVLNTTKHDTTKVNTLSILGYHYLSKDSATAINYINKGIALAKKINYPKGLGNCYNSLGMIYKKIGKFSNAIVSHNKALTIFIETDDKKNICKTYNYIGTAFSEEGNYPLALENYNKALDLFIELKDDAGTAKCYNVMGMAYKDQGDYTKAIDLYMQALKIRDKLGDTKGIISCYTNIGLVHSIQENPDKALDYFQQALDLSIKANEKKGVLGSYNNIGNIYMNKGEKCLRQKDTLKAIANQNKAIENFEKTIALLEETKDKKNLASCYNNLGQIYISQKNSIKALFYLEKAYKIFEEVDAKEEISIVCANLSTISIDVKEFEDALFYAQKSFDLAKKTGSLYGIKRGYEVLALANKALGNFKEALDNYEKSIKYKDSIFDTEKSKQFAELDEIYQSEKKQKEIALQKSEIKQQKTQKYAFVIGFALMLVLAVFILKSYQAKKRANLLLESQKKIIEEKNEALNQTNAEIAAQRDHISEINEEITDSIKYAQRIQRAMLPSFENEKNLVAPLEIFVLFKPRDIVSGDFYFIARRKNWVLIAAADCTGHGVPGAFMSMLGISFLNEIVSNENVQTAAHVLDELRKSVIHSLQQKGSTGEQKDGMDMGFVAINLETLEVQFAGANNPMLLIRKSENPELTDIKPDKMPVGIFVVMQNFTNQTIQLQKGDIFYLLSDGYQDQFGGPKFKKFLSKNLKNLLLDIHQKQMEEQRQILDDTIENWKNSYGKCYHQTDDITIVGIRV